MPYKGQEQISWWRPPRFAPLLAEDPLGGSNGPNGYTANPGERLRANNRCVFESYLPRLWYVDAYPMVFVKEHPIS
jgi:hypothetical protein